MSSSAPPSMRPYGRQALICSGDRCTSPEAAQEIARLLAKLIQDRGLSALRNPERIKCTLTGCLGVCAGGPILAVYPEGIWYHHVDAEALAEIFEHHLLGGTPVEARVFHRLYPRGAEPVYPPKARGEEGGWQASPDSPSLHSEEEVQAAEDYRKMVRRAHKKKGLILVHTGNGKGKTTAALGLLLRAWGRGLRVGVIQFLKNEGARFGEVRAAERLGIDWKATGNGWTWTSKDLEESAARARSGWALAQEKIASGGYDVLVLDEFTYLLAYGWLPTGEVVAWLREHKPSQMHLVITGRNAPPALVELADLVTEMREVKHPFRDQGIRAQPGIEF